MNHIQDITLASVVIVTAGCRVAFAQTQASPAAGAGQFVHSGVGRGRDHGLLRRLDNRMAACALISKIHISQKKQIMSGTFRLALHYTLVELFPTVLGSRQFS